MHSALRGCARIGRQLHPLKDERPNMSSYVRPFTGMSLFLSVCLPVYLSIQLSVCRSVRCQSVRSLVYPSVRPSRVNEISEKQGRIRGMRRS